MRRALKGTPPLSSLILLLLLTACSTGGGGGGSGPQALQTQPIAREDGLPVAAPSDVGLDEAMLSQLTDRLANARMNVHSVLIMKDGKLVYEAYRKGRDEKWGESVGVVQFGPDTLHDARSMTKSVVALLVGIALEEGYIQSIDEPVLRYFPEYYEESDAQKRRMTIRNLLTMTTGVSWNETVAYSSAGNTEIQRLQSGDSLEFVFGQQMAASPGRKFTYSGGSTTLLAILVERATAHRIEDYARIKLFQPMGITNWSWTFTPEGEIAAASGLRLRSRDMLKLGWLLLNEGNWQGKQLVPRDWVLAATGRNVPLDQRWGYGYQFWTCTFKGREQTVHTYLASGRGGQRILVAPDLNMVLVVTAGEYNADLNQLLAGQDILMEKYVLPASGI